MKKEVKSWLCASALKSNLSARALACGADVVHFDLEDSVPREQKAAARSALQAQRHSIAEHFNQLTTAVRINPLSTVDGLRDLLFLVEHRLPFDIVILPKASLWGDITLASQILQEGKVASRIFAVIESAQAVADLRLPGAAPGGLSGLIFGAADLAAEFQVELHKTDFSWVRQEMALAARRLQVAAVDSPCFEIRSPEFLEKELAQARQFGFSGKIAIHPSQVSAINACFAPSTALVEQARRILDAHEQKGLEPIVELGPRVSGPPMVRWARSVLLEATPAIAEVKRRSE